MVRARGLPKQCAELSRLVTTLACDRASYVELAEPGFLSIGHAGKGKGGRNMEDKIPSGAEAEIRLKRIATESERQQEAHVRGWLELAKKLFESDEADGSAVTSPTIQDAATAPTTKDD